MKKFCTLVGFLLVKTMLAQHVMTPELLLQLGRVNPLGISKDGKNVVYQVGTPEMTENKVKPKFYLMPVEGGEAKEITDPTTLLKNKDISPDGRCSLFVKNVAVQTILASKKYADADQSTAYIYKELDYRHWDKDNDGTYKHLWYSDENGNSYDLLEGEPYYAPQEPFGGDDDYTWSPDGKKIVYVSKKVAGTKYAISTNTDLFEYDLQTKKTINLTESNKGYDTHPVYAPFGKLSWLQMKRDGYEADKNDIIVRVNEAFDLNLTAHWDGTVQSFQWSPDGKLVYFIAPIDGTTQLFTVEYTGLTKKLPFVTQLTNGDFDVTSIIGFSGNQVLVTRTDMNHAAEIFSFDVKKKIWKQLTHVNDEAYSKIALSKIERRYVTTTDGKKMLVWVVFPPNFDPAKKYPTLLYCQGGPQSIVSQFYSFRWNFQLMAANGYIVVAPNRRGLPGFGMEWNEAISKDWAGQSMNDYLTAIDELAKEPYVDNARLGAVGASYGGYSVYYLAGIHNNRFKSLIAHCGVFNLESMYGTTEEVFFTNWDLGGPYWDTKNEVAQKAYRDFNPKNLVAKWNTPIMVIHGGKDYRVPIGQGQEAFQAAQLLGIKSQFLYFPDENHWVSKPQNALVWQREFFQWLKETL